MSLDDRLRDAGDALVGACANSDDLDRGARLLQEAYRRLQSDPPACVDALVVDDDEAVYNMGVVCETQGDLLGAALCFQQAAATGIVDAAARFAAVLTRLHLRSVRPDDGAADVGPGAAPRREVVEETGSPEAESGRQSPLRGAIRWPTFQRVGAVVDTVKRLSKLAPAMRSGLTEEAADQATKHLVEMLKCVAVGVTDPEGRLLSWDGGASEHYEDLTGAIDLAIRNNQRAQIHHTTLDCDRRGRCPMRTAVIVPLITDGQAEGTLIVVGGVNSKRLIRAADEVATFVCIQLELAKLDESKQQLARAEIRMLRAQISPHFLSNALNSISSMIRTDPERARDLLQEFADFTRYSFRTSGQFTTLAEELRNIDRYLTIQSQRYADRLNVRIKIAPEVLSVVVPFLVLQPLVESAVQHGILPKLGGGTVTVIAQDNGNEALIIVEDDGVGMDPDRLFADRRDAHMTGAHVAIGNINQRMRSLFGDEYALMAETAPGAGMKVILRVPKFFPGVRPDLPTFAPVCAHPPGHAGSDRLPTPS